MKCTSIKRNELLNLIGNLCLIIYEISTCLLLVFNARGLLSKYSIKIALIYYIIGDIRRKVENTCPVEGWWNERKIFKFND